MRCVYCVNELELYRVDPGVQGCKQCGLQYSDELLTDLDTEQFLGNPRYRIERFDGNPPTVEVTDLSPTRSDGAADNSPAA